MLKNIPPVNLKEQTAKYSFRVTIRDPSHFYKIVNWLNAHVGKGTEKWTMEGHALRVLKEGKTVSRKIYIYIDNFDESSALYLSLL